MTSGEGGMDGVNGPGAVVARADAIGAHVSQRSLKATDRRLAPVRVRLRPDRGMAFMPHRALRRAASVDMGRVRGTIQWPAYLLVT